MPSVCLLPSAADQGFQGSSDGWNGSSLGDSQCCEIHTVLCQEGEREVEHI